MLKNIFFLSVLAFFNFWDFAFAQENISSQEKCLSPTQSPLCAAKAWNACWQFRNLELCQAVAPKITKLLGTYVMDEQNKNLNLSDRSFLSQFTLSKSFKGVREVSSSRFHQTKGREKTPVDPMYHGTVEVMYEGEYCINCLHKKSSEFFKKTDQGWQLASWSSGYLPEPCFIESKQNQKGSECEYFIQVDPYKDHIIPPQSTVKSSPFLPSSYYQDLQKSLRRN